MMGILRPGTNGWTTFLPWRCLYLGSSGWNGDGGITKHGFRTSGSNDNLLVAAFDLVGEADNDTEFDALVGRVAGNIHECATVELFLVDLQVGERGVELAAPVDETVGTVDDAVLVQLAECLGNGLGARGIHGESLSREVVRGTETTHLVRDTRLVVVLPLEDLFEELLTTIVVARLAFELCKALLNDTLGSDTGVVVTRLKSVL